MRAAVLSNPKRPLEIVELELEPLEDFQVKVRLAASGVCHTDLSIARGILQYPLPIVLGHEGAGVVEEIGAGVSSVRPGDHVVLSWIAQCGRCYSCRRGQPYVCESFPRGAVPSPFRSGGQVVHQMMTTGTFAEVTIVPEAGVVPINRDVPLHLAALLGCGVLTGVGAALNTARIEPGDTVAVFGCGGVGLNTIQGARIAGASRVIAVDTNGAKYDLARRFGATETTDGGPGAARQLLELTGGRGVDVAFDVVGASSVVEEALAATRRGGQVVLVGVATEGTTVPIDLLSFVRSSIELRASYYGSTNSRRDVPRLLELWRAGRLLLEELVSGEIELHQIEEALSAIEAGTATRSIIRF